MSGQIERGHENVGMAEETWRVFVNGTLFVVFSFLGDSPAS